MYVYTRYLLEIMSINTYRRKENEKSIHMKQTKQKPFLCFNTIEVEEHRHKYMYIPVNY